MVAGQVDGREGAAVVGGRRRGGGRDEEGGVLVVVVEVVGLGLMKASKLVTVSCESTFRSKSVRARARKGLDFARVSPTCKSTWLGSMSQISSSYASFLSSPVSCMMNSLNMSESRFLLSKKIRNQSPICARFISTSILSCNEGKG